MNPGDGRNPDWLRVTELVAEALRGCIITVQNHPRVKLRAVVLKIIVDSIELELLRPLPGG